MLTSATEILVLTEQTDYNCHKITDDKRGGKLGYWQVGPSGGKVGIGSGPIVELECVRIGGGGTTHMAIWTHQMDLAAPGILYALAYYDPSSPSFCGTTLIKDVYIRRFAFCDSAGNETTVGSGYTVYGKRLAAPPLQILGLG